MGSLLARGRRFWIEWVLICATLATLSVLSFRDQWPWRIDLTLYDAGLSAWQRIPSDDIVIVAIDEASLSMQGRWPWSRATIAQLFERIAAGHPRAVAIDLFFTEPDANPAVDVRLARALEALPGSVLATFREDAQGVRRYLLPLPMFASAAKSLAHVHVEVDPDAVVRSVYLREGSSSPDTPHFALALAAGAGAAPPAMPGVKRPDVAPTSGLWQRDFWFRVPFSGPPGNVARVSADDVIAGRGLERLRGRFVFVGATAVGLGDAYAVPTSASGRLMPGVEISANVLDGLLAGIDIRDPARGLALAIGPGAVLLAMLACLFLRPREALLATFFVAFAVLLGSALALNFAQTWYAPSSAVIAVMFCYPLWSWRRLDASLAFMREELGALRSEPDLLPIAQWPPVNPAPGVVDVVQRSIELVRQANERTRVLRRFVVDTLALQADGVLVIDHERRVVLCNARAQVLLGLDEDPRGTAVREAFRNLTDLEERLWDMLEASSTATGVQQAEARNAGGGELLVTTTACEGGGTGLIGYIVNLTDVSALKAAARAREEAMGFLSHDLRAPQASILAALELRRADPDSVSESQLVDQIERSARRTLALAEAFVTLTRADHLDPARFHAVELGDVCREAADEAWPLCRTRRIRCDLVLADEEAWMRGERPLLVAVVLNLIDNAVKYSPEGSRVEVALRRQFDAWVITISDQGPGISAADIPRLFERFRRLGREGRSGTRGAGLGLVIVDTVVRKHDGRIEVVSTVGSGTSFVVHLPASAPVADST